MFVPVFQCPQKLVRTFNSIYRKHIVYTAWKLVRTAIATVYVPGNHCCGSGSVASVCFWTSQIRIHWYEVRIRILLSSRNGKKTLIPTALWLIYHFLFLKNYVNIASKSSKEFFFSILKVTDENSRSRFRIRIRRSEVRIRGSRCGFGSVPKCRGSATLPYIFTLLSWWN